MVDPEVVGVILGALSAGAATGAGDLARGAVSETGKAAAGSLAAAKERLLGLVASRLQKEGVADEDAVTDLKVFVKRPTQENLDALRPRLLEYGVHLDDAVMALAQQIVAEPGVRAFGQGAVAGHIVRQDVHGGHGHIGGVQNYGFSGDISPDPR